MVFRRNSKYNKTESNIEKKRILKLNIIFFWFSLGEYEVKENTYTLKSVFVENVQVDFIAYDLTMRSVMTV